MPQVIPFISSIIGAISSAAGAIGSALGSIGAFLGSGTLLSSFVQIGLSFGLSYLSSILNRPKPPSPEDVQQSSRQPLSPRYRHYGRVKVSGAWVFAESKAGNFHKVLALGTGQSDGIEEFYVDQKVVTRDGAGNVQEHPFNGNVQENPFNPNVSTNYHLRIEVRLGLPVETNYASLTTAIPEWTTAHRLDGITSLYAFQRASSSEVFYEVFPNSINTLYRVVMRASIVQNPVTGLFSWSDNAASVILDYCRHEDGARMPADLFVTSEALAITQTSFNSANIAIPLKAGGSEAQWRLWGSYSLAERPGDVLGRMLSCCDATLKPTRDGGIGIEILEYSEPAIIIDETMITGFADLARGRDIMSTANVISATYVSPDHDYQSTEAEPWFDDSDVAARGEIELSTSFIMAPSHGQCRRMMKRTSYRANPNWRGTFELNIKGIACYGERLVRIRYPLFGIDEVFEVADFRFKLGDGGLLLGAVIQVSSMPEAAFVWDATLEEGEPEPYVESDGVTTIPTPTGFGVVIARENISGVQVPFADLSWTNDGNPSLETEAEYKKTADSTWILISVAPGASTARSPALTDNTSYDFRVRHRTLGARKGAYTGIATINVVADNTAPAVVNTVSVTGGVNQVTVNWKAPNSANYVAANIRRNTVNVEGSASLIQTAYGPPNVADSYIDGGLAVGTYYYWIKARNPSGVESASVATGSAVVV